MYLMLTSFDKFKINEKLLISEENTVDICILFTDIVSSSKHWKNNEKSMIKALEELSITMDKIVKNNNGVIIKTIGDAYMIAFEKLVDSIETGIEIQQFLKQSPIKVGRETLKMRIGMCNGPVYKTTVEAQNQKLIDYLGNTVNTASRIESNVAIEGGIAFATLSTKEKDLDALLEQYDVDLISYTNKGDSIRRSSRILTDIQRHIHKNVKSLKGVDKIDVYTIKDI